MAKNDRNRLLLAAGLGGLIGAAVALLLAPKSGQATRAQLREVMRRGEEAMRGRGEEVEKRRSEEAKERRGGSFFASSRPATSPPSYDVVIIGGGHNGLVTAAYLAKAGRKVLVLERRPVVGGAAVTEEFFPGFKFSACADGAGRLSPQLIRDLQLDQQGLEILPSDPLIFAPQPDGSRLTLWRDPAQTLREIERFSRADAAHYLDFNVLIQRVAQLVGGLMAMTPPDVPDLNRADLLALLKLAGPAFKLGPKELNQVFRILPMSVADLLGEWFEAEALKGLIAAQGITGITWGPKEAGTAYMLLQQCTGSEHGFLRPAGVVRGGMGQLSQAIAAAARHYGAEIRTGVEVAEVIVREGWATGVALAGGEEISAAVVISNADPRTTFLKLLDPQYMEPFFLQQVRHIKYRGSGARVHLALDRLPHFTALNGGDPATYLSGHIQIAPSIDYLEQAYDDAKYGHPSRQPYLDVLIPSLTDPSLAPAGKHLMSIYVQYAPYQLKPDSAGDPKPETRNSKPSASNWEVQREAFGEAVIDALAQYAPDLKDTILDCHVLTPLDLETIYGLPEGNPNHGEMTLDQFLYMRPVPGYAQYRTPIQGLYLCGAGTHPGGGVTGLPGYNAAREILKDWKSAR